MSDCPIRVAVIGAGNRATVYSKYSLNRPGDMKIVAVVEPNDFRRRKFADTFTIPPENTFTSVEDFLRCEKFADAVINGTMDKKHVATSLPLLKAGYSILLEKPIGTDIGEVMQLYSAAKESKKIVMICHVLRYAPFYQKIKEYVSSGCLGNIINIQMSENVSYHHMAASYIRGKWSSGHIAGHGMLMSKCCHDFDLLVWLKNGIPPVKVCSFGSLMEFKKEKKPLGAGTRCLVDCKMEKDCIYSARKLYLEHPNRWTQYIWSGIEKNGELSDKAREISLATDNPQGCCIWDTENSSVVDHQSVLTEFEDGSTATHNMTCGTARGARYTHIIGTKGEIQGCLEDDYFEFRQPDTKNKMGFASEKIRINAGLEMHGGGDMRLVEDFVNILKGRGVSQSTTLLEDSILGFMLAYNAEVSRKQNRPIELAGFLKDEKPFLPISSYAIPLDVKSKGKKIKNNYCDMVSRPK